MATEPIVQLTRAVDNLMHASNGIGGLFELVLSQPEDQKIVMTRKKLSALLLPIEAQLTDAKEQVNDARQALKTSLKRVA